MLGISKSMFLFFPYFPFCLWKSSCPATAELAWKHGSVSKELGDDLWRCIIDKLDMKSMTELQRVNVSFRNLVQKHMIQSWNRWNIWKNQVPLYPPEVSGYSTAAKSVDKLLFERLVCLRGAQRLSLGSFEREGRRCHFLMNKGIIGLKRRPTVFCVIPGMAVCIYAMSSREQGQAMIASWSWSGHSFWYLTADCVICRFVHWRAAAMTQNIPGIASKCRKGDYQYKSTFLELPAAFTFSTLVDSQPPEAQAVLEAVSLMCHDCGQKKDGGEINLFNQHFCTDCYVDKSQAPATWTTFVHY